MWCYMLERISQLLYARNSCGYGEKGFACCNLPLSSLGITWGQCWETNECWACSKTTGFTWLPPDCIALGSFLHRGEQKEPGLTHSPCCLRAVRQGPCSPGSELTSFVKDKACCISLTPPSPLHRVLVPPLTWTETNSSLASSLPLAEHSTTGAPHQPCPAHFSRDFVCIPWMSVSRTSHSLCA